VVSNNFFINDFSNLLPLLFSCKFDSFVPTPSPFGPTSGCSLTCTFPDAAPIWGQLLVALPSASSPRSKTLRAGGQAFGSLPRLGVRLCASWLNLFAAIFCPLNRLAIHFQNFPHHPIGMESLLKFLLRARAANHSAKAQLHHASKTLLHPTSRAHPQKILHSRLKSFR